MTYPYVNFFEPAQRPGALQDWDWIGGNADLVGRLHLFDYNQNLVIVPFPAQAADSPQRICMPNSATINDLDLATVKAHLRMGSCCSNAVLGTTEWIDGFAEGLSDHLQTAIGAVKVLNFRRRAPPNQLEVEVDIQKGSGAIRTIVMTDDELPSLLDYRAACESSPSTMILPEVQALCIAGAIEKAFPSYVHDPPNGIYLTQAKKDDVTAYVKGLLAVSGSFIPPMYA